MINGGSRKHHCIFCTFIFLPRPFRLVCPPRPRNAASNVITSRVTVMQWLSFLSLYANTSCLRKNGSFVNMASCNIRAIITRPGYESQIIISMLKRNFTEFKYYEHTIIIINTQMIYFILSFN